MSSFSTSCPLGLESVFGVNGPNLQNAGQISSWCTQFSDSLNMDHTSCTNAVSSCAMATPSYGPFTPSPPVNPLNPFAPVDPFSPFTPFSPLNPFTPDALSQSLCGATPAQTLTQCNKYGVSSGAFASAAECYYSCQQQQQQNNPYLQPFLAAVPGQGPPPGFYPPAMAPSPGGSWPPGPPIGPSPGFAPTPGGYWPPGPPIGPSPGSAPTPGSAFTPGSAPTPGYRPMSLFGCQDNSYCAPGQQCCVPVGGTSSICTLSSNCF